MIFELLSGLDVCFGSLLLRSVCFVYALPSKQDSQTAGGAGLVGGEEEALKRLQKFALDVPNQTSKSKGSKSQAEPGGDSLYGANFSCKISPWLAMGCLSPRRMFEDLKKSGSRFALLLSSATHKP